MSEAGKVWHFSAPLSLVGAPTLDGCVPTEDGCVPADPGGGAAALAPVLPVPVLGRKRVHWRPDADPGDTDLHTVGVLRRVTPRGDEVVGSGWFADTVLGRHYAGALALETVWFQIDMGDAQRAPCSDDTITVSRWRVMLGDWSACPVVRVSAPRVWQAARPVARGFAPG